MPPTQLRFVDTPLGRVAVLASAAGISRLVIDGPAGLPARGADDPDPTSAALAVLDEAERQLRAVFAGRRAGFDLPLDVVGSEFQNAVWSALVRVPRGEVISYGALAAAAGFPGASRAVGGAVGANPVPVLVPCHRVLASDGRITGYTPGRGVATKLELLAMEGIEVRAPRRRRETPLPLGTSA